MSLGIRGVIVAAALAACAARGAPAQNDPTKAVKLAAAFSQEGDFARAAETLQGGIAGARESAELWMKWADFALERFRILGPELRRTQSGMAAVMRLQGEGLQDEKESREALLKQSATADPEQRGIWGELGVEQIRIGMREEATATLKTARERQPEDLWTLRLEAVEAAAHGDWRNAETHLLELGGRSPAVFRRTMGTWPRNLVPEENVPGEIWECARKNSAACFDKIEFSPSEVQNIEEQLFAEERWERLAALPEPSSKATIYRAPKDTPPAYEQSPAWFRRGVALAELNDCAHAIPALERGLDAGDETAAYWLERCYASEAERAASRLEALGKEADSDRVRGDFLVRVKSNAQSAVAEYTKARQLQPRDAGLAERLAQACMSIGEMQQAQKAAREALALDPHRPVSLRLLASIAMNERDYANALALLSEKLRLTPNDAWARVQMGIAYAQMGQPQQAFSYLQPALAAGYPDERGALHAMLASVLRKLGREQEAQSAAAEANRLSDLFQQHPQKSVDEHP